MTVRQLIILSAALIVMGCPPKTLDPSLYNTSDPCVGACKKFEDLHCVQARPTPDGTTCLEFCRVHEYGAGVYRVNAPCIVSDVVQTCEDANKCAK